MPRMKNDKSHTVKHSSLYLLGNFIGNSRKLAMSPPNENVGVIEDLLGYSAVFKVMASAMFSPVSL